MNNLQGLKFHVMEKKGNCNHCKQPIDRGCKSVVIGSKYDQELWVVSKELIKGVRVEKEVHRRF